MTELTAFARIHAYGLSGHNPATAFTTEPGGVHVFLDEGDIRIKATTSKIVGVAGGPEKWLREFWPEAEFEFPPFNPEWQPKAAPEAPEFTTLDLP